MKTLLVDVDEVLLQYGFAMETYLKDVKKYHLEKDIAEVYHLKLLLDISDDEETEIITDFGHSEYFENIPPYEESVIGLDKFKSKGYEIHAITAIDYDPKTFYKRRKNLDKFFPKMITDIYMTGAKRTKLNALELFKPSIFIDDQPKHLITSLNCEHKPHIMHKKYNKDFSHENITRVSNIIEVFEKIYN